ncbi:MAG TPA: hypothetical protein VNL16_10620 [Chloroflexota bacterium]|nr:hypothetical protein [Chloroflexota bacterium]
MSIDRRSDQPPGSTLSPESSSLDAPYSLLAPYEPSELETVARLLLQDRPVRVVAGAWWSYYPERGEVSYPATLLTEWPARRSLGALCHEIAEVLFSGSAAVPIFEQFIGWAIARGCELRTAELLLNAINDLRVNRLYLEQFPGSRPYFLELYREATLIQKNDFDQRQIERQVLPHHVFIDAVTDRWSAALAHDAPRTVSDDRVRRAVSRCWPSIARAVACQELAALAEIVQSEVFPAYLELVSASREAVRRATAAETEPEESTRPETPSESEGEDDLIADDLTSLVRGSPIDDEPPVSWVILPDADASQSEADDQEEKSSAPPPVVPVDGTPLPKPEKSRWTGGIIQKFRRLGHRGRSTPAYEDFNYVEAVRRLGPQIDALLNGTDGREGLIAILNRRRFGTFDPWRRPRRWRKGDSGEVDPDHAENLVISPATAFLKGRRQPRDDSQKDFAHVILLDVSGSVVQRGYRSRKFDQLIDTMVVFCEIHERLKIPYELIAFSDRFNVLRSFDECRFENLQIDPTSAYVPKDLSYLVQEMYQAEHAETQETPCLDRAIVDLGEPRGMKTIFMVTDGISSDRLALTERLLEIERHNQVVPRNERLMLLAFGVGLAEDEFKASYQPEIDGQPIPCSTGQLVRTVESLPMIVCDSVDRRIRTA